MLLISSLYPPLHEFSGGYSISTVCVCVAFAKLMRAVLCSLLVALCAVGIQGQSVLQASSPFSFGVWVVSNGWLNTTSGQVWKADTLSLSTAVKIRCLPSSSVAPVACTV